MEQTKTKRKKIQKMGKKSFKQIETVQTIQRSPNTAIKLNLLSMAFVDFSFSILKIIFLCAILKRQYSLCFLFLCSFLSFLFISFFYSHLVVRSFILFIIIQNEIEFFNNIIHFIIIIYVLKSQWAISIYIFLLPVVYRLPSTRLHCCCAHNTGVTLVK